MKYFYTLLGLFCFQLVLAQHHISEVGTPVDGLETIPGVIQENVSNDLIQETPQSAEESNVLFDPIPIGDVDFNGATKGQFSVSNGAATYNLPIETPPGINGIEPKVGITYNSQAGNGIVGYGWNISGLSSIKKVGSNKYFDGKNSSINYSQDDRFMLDGQRLLLKSGIYGMDGTEYQTENYSNLKITSHGNPQSNYGPEYFKVQYPDGSTAFYGRSYALFNGGVTRTNTTYALTYITNPQNVIIKYSYINDNGNLLISNITYGYRSTNPLNEIRLANTTNYISFTYKDRNRGESGYVFNDGSKVTKILDKITVRGYAENYRTYQLTYTTTSLGYERLQKITETSGDGTLSKSPVTFSYGSDPTQNLLTELPSTTVQLQSIKNYNTKVIPGDFSGSGKLGYLLYHTTYDSGNPYDATKQFTQGNVLRIFDPATTTLYSRSFSTPFNEVVSTKSLNFNNILLPNQGFTTITKTNTVPYGGHHTFNFDSFIFMPDYWGQMAQISSKSFNLRNYQDGNHQIRDYFISGDFNGDGISDIIRTEFPGNYKDNDFDQYSTQLEIIDLKNDAVYNNQTIPIGFAYYVVDTDGDGYDEFIVARHQNILVYKFNRNSNKLEHSHTINAPQLSYTEEIKKPLYMGDFNGDGKLDFVFPSAKGSYVWLFYINKGDGNYKYISKNLAVKYIGIEEQEVYRNSFRIYTKVQEPNYMFQDINNDGKTDIVLAIDNYKRDNDGDDYDNETLIGFYDNLKFDSENEDINFSFTEYANLSTANRSNAIYTVSNYNDNSLKTEIGYLSNDRLGTLEYKKNNVITQQLKTINEFDLTTKITYESYNEKKNNPATDGEDAVLPFVSFDQPMSIYPKVDIDVAPGFYLVKKVAYNSEKGILIGGSPDRKQLFSYADATINHNGKGFLGFKGSMVTNIYTGGPTIYDLQDQIKNITIFDLDNNGLVKEEYVAHSTDWANFFTTPVNFLTKKVNTYNITNLSNKVFKAQNTQSVINDGLTGIQRTINSTYDAYSNPLSVTETVTGGGETSTLNSVFTYIHSLANDNYYIGRPASKTIKMNNVQTSKEVYTYTNHLLTNVTKQGAVGSSELSETNEFDIFGNVIKKTISASGIQPRIASYVYDTTGRYIEKATDTEGLETTYDYNKNKGWLLSQTNPYGLTSSSSFNALGMTISETDYLGNATNFAYKTNTRVLGSSFVRKETNYSDGRKEKVTTTGWGNKTYEGYTDIDGNWVGTSYSYDSQDRLIKKSEPYTSTASLFTTFEYDKYGRVIKTVLPTGREITASYSGLSSTINDGVKTKTETKNANNQTKKVVDNGETINYSYNPNGTLKNTNYGGTVISFEYDGWGRKTKMTDPSAGTYTYQYNSIGDLLKETTPNGNTVYTYDATGKIATTSHSGKNIAYNYNADKLPTNIITNSADGPYVENFTYDNYKRIIAKKYTTPLGFTYNYTYTFDNLGRVLTEEKKVTGASGTDAVKTKNVYKNGYLWKLQNAATNTDLKVYNSFNQRGQVTSFTLANGLVTNRTYDQYGYLTQNTVNKNNIAFFTLNNTWDVQRGNLTSRSNTLFTGGINETFQYDTFDRLTNNSTKQGAVIIAQETNTYDGKGRILNNNVGDYNYDSAKAYQLQNVENLNDLAYYQNNPLQQVTYNTHKAPLTIKQQGKENIYFKYDGFDNRVAMYYGNEAADETASSKIRYYSPAGDIEVDFDKATNKYIVNMYVDGDPYAASIIQRKENNATAFYYLHRDYLGSILAVTNSTGAIVEKRHFDAWGNVLLVQNGQNNNLGKLTFLERGYTGHEHLQGVGLINMNARLYDAKLHRFLAPDNFIQDPNNSQGFNRYGYAWNNPLKFTDPSGEIIIPILIGIGVGILTNGISNSINDKPFFQGAVQAGIIGGISGAISFGIGSSLMGASGFAKVGMGVIAHGFSGAIISSTSGGNLGSGFAAGAIGSGIASGIGASGISNHYWMSAAQIGGATVAGGTVSVIAGGNFWDGARMGFITSALNHVAHDIHSRNKVNKNLRNLGINPKDKVPYELGSIYKLMINDPTLLDLYIKGDYPDIEIGSVYGKSKNAGGATYGDYSTKTVKYIGINKIAFRNYYYLYQVVGHELYHAYQIVSGFSLNAVNMYGSEKGTYLIEMGGYQWNYRMNPSDDFFSDMFTKMINSFYEK